MFSSEERRSSLEKSKFQLLRLLYSYIKHSRRPLISLQTVSASFLENRHSKLGMWNSVGACAATKPCCHPPVCKLECAGGSRKENLNSSALWGQGKLECTASAEVTAARCFVDRYLRKRQRLSLNKPWHPLPECCGPIHTMGPRKKSLSYLSWGPDPYYNIGTEAVCILLLAAWNGAGLVASQECVFH